MDPFCRSNFPSDEGIVDYFTYFCELEIEYRNLKDKLESLLDRKRQYEALVARRLFEETQEPGQQEANLQEPKQQELNQPALDQQGLKRSTGSESSKKLGSGVSNRRQRRSLDEECRLLQQELDQLLSKKPSKALEDKGEPSTSPEAVFVPPEGDASALVVSSPRGFQRNPSSDIEQLQEKLKNIQMARGSLEARFRQYADVGNDLKNILRRKDRLETQLQNQSARLAATESLCEQVEIDLRKIRIEKVLLEAQLKQAIEERRLRQQKLMEVQESLRLASSSSSEDDSEFVSKMESLSEKDRLNRG